jgi:endonuclease YncB( thermonuclease family)
VALAAAAEAAPARRARNAAPQCPQAGTKTVYFAKAIDGQSFATPDGTEIRLAGVLAAGAGGETLSGSQASAARAALAAAVQAGALEMAELGHDRYGRIVAYLFAGGAPVAQTLLKAGQARAAPDAVSAPCAVAFLIAENDARAAKAGHWGDGLFAARAPEGLSARLGTFQIVEGIIVDAAQIKGRAFINFGADYKTDFTVTVAPSDMRGFRRAKLDVKTLAGKRVRVRGWVELYNGPEMTLTTPSAFEVLD